jgi:hypothetical protein
MHRNYLVILISALLTGCGGTKVVFVHPADHDLVRLGPDVRGHVYFWNGSEWELSKNSVSLPEGWYAGYVSPEGESSKDPSQIQALQQPPDSAAAGRSSSRQD